jgi:amyloid beta precursor protein binding protein 1
MATDDKYDRQLRLWGPHGQRALMQANILLINADAVGTETLKNLVLPGVGRFTVVDAKVVSPADAGSNFFVTTESIGEPRAQVVTELLTEMNPDVEGSYKIGSIEAIMAEDPAYLKQYSLVITSNVIGESLLNVSNLCWQLEVPLLIVRSYGLIGYCRLQLKDHDIIESKPDGDQMDLRVANPFSELASYCNNFDLENLDSMEHAHVPYVVLLYKAITQYKRDNNGSLPRKFAEKERFKGVIKSFSNNVSNELNFQEAVREAYRAFTKKVLSVEAEELLKAQKSEELKEGSSDFRFLLRALQAFMETSEDANVPLAGQLPDMVSTTQYFIELQKLFQAKAAADRQTMMEILNTLLQEVGRPVGSIPYETVDLFCKNIFNVSLVSTRTVLEEASGLHVEKVTEAIEEPYEDAAQTPILWYMGLRAVDIFHAKNGRYPGTMSSEFETDVDALYSDMLAFQKQLNVSALSFSSFLVTFFILYVFVPFHSLPSFTFCS